MEDFEALVITPVGNIETWNQAFKPLKIDAEFYAIGTGGGIALGAMSAGASAEKAVRIACEYDLYTGGEVKTLHSLC